VKRNNKGPKLLTSMPSVWGDIRREKSKGGHPHKKTYKITRKTSKRMKDVSRNPAYKGLGRESVHFSKSLRVKWSISKNTKKDVGGSKEEEGLY